MIQFKNVTKIYPGGVHAIKNVSFHVEDGEFVNLIGPSGCGKTTLLRMVNQLEEITTGNIFINNKDITSLDKIKLRRNIGYVIQSIGLFPNMTIEDNVMIVPSLLGWDRKKQNDRFNYLMDLIGMHSDQYRNRYPHELSGGQQQRIGVIRALAADPPIMLMDEPFGALDPLIRDKLQAEFIQIQKELKKTILFVSHDIDEAIKMGDKIALLRDGELIQYSNPVDMLMHPKNEFVANFIGHERVLKSTGLYTINDLQNEIDLPYSNNTGESISINEDVSLRKALSTLLNYGVDGLVVIDENKQAKGCLSLRHIETFLHKRTREKQHNKVYSNE